jgi:hypothetical protein
MDLLNLEKAINKFNEESVPRIEDAIQRLVDRLDLHIDQDLKDAIEGINKILDRVDGSTLVIRVPPRIKA